MKNRLTNNLGLKLASIFFAMVLWLVVNSINNPTVSESYYNIPVKLLNTDLITDSNQVYEILENTDVINRVVVRAPRSVIEELKTDNIIATADVSELSSLDTISIRLATNVSARDITSITGSIDTVKLNIENKRSKALSLKATVSGEVEEGYMVGDITTDQNLVRISGPQSVIDQIVKASVDVDVTGMTSDIVTDAEVRFYDSEDKVVKAGNITQNIKTVGVRIAIGQTATVPVNFTISGVPASGFRYTGEIEGNGESVLITGRASAIKNVTSIEVPAEVLDITDRAENLVAALRTVTVYIEPEISRRLEIREERVRITNLPEGYDASISGLDERFTIEVAGLSRDVSELQAGNISGTVDIEKLMLQKEMEYPEPGFYTVEVDFGLPEEISLQRPVTVTLHISELEGEENE